MAPRQAALTQRAARRPRELLRRADDLIPQRLRRGDEFLAPAAVEIGDLLCQG